MPEPEVSKEELARRVSYLNHGGVKILVLDVSEVADTEKTLYFMERCQDEIMKQPLKSVLLLSNVTNARLQ